MLVFLCLILSFLPPIFASEWSYNNTKQWARKSRYCAGHLQSPIDLQYNVSHFDRRLKAVVIEETATRGAIELVNTGHTVQLNVPNSYILKDVAPLSEDYKVQQIHFHWGHTHDNTVGSEHTQEGKAYPLEIHMVSYSSLFSSINDAMSNVRGLAVVGAFFQLTDEPNPALQPLVEAIEKVRAKNQQTKVAEEFNLKSLFGEDRLGRYYRYDGSLTTPPCYESVVWTVLVDPIPISLPQLHAFRYLHDEHAHLIENTYRKVQKLGQRLLFRSFLSKDPQEDIQERSWNLENHGGNLMMNMKLILLLTLSLLITKF